MTDETPGDTDGGKEKIGETWEDNLIGRLVSQRKAEGQVINSSLATTTGMFVGVSGSPLWWTTEDRLVDCKSTRKGSVLSILNPKTLVSLDLSLGSKVLSRLHRIPLRKPASTTQDGSDDRTRHDLR